MPDQTPLLASGDGPHEVKDCPDPFGACWVCAPDEMADLDRQMMVDLDRISASPHVGLAAVARELKAREIFGRRPRG